jgi:hypothetical protein
MTGRSVPSHLSYSALPQPRFLDAVQVLLSCYPGTLFFNPILRRCCGCFVVVVVYAVRLIWFPPPYDIDDVKVTMM